MASSSLSRTWRYRVFASFHGPDVRKTFLSHLRRQFNENGITMFDDEEIERGETLTPALQKAIRESRILIIVLSQNYASSGWCLDELLEILRCKKDMGQTVMTVFHGVDPSDVRKQTGEFGRVFNKTCALKTEEKRQSWSQALTEAANIAGEHFQNWVNELKMIVNISRDVSNKLNTTLPKEFKDIVGIERHMRKMQSHLRLEDEDGAMIVGICGPAGIGKTTIARALHSRHSSSFQLSCFMENLRGICNSGLDDYGLKLSLQEQLLSKILNLNGMRINGLGAIQERLCDLKVLIILDDVDDLKQLEALADEPNWFGPGSRIIVTTEDQELLEQHDINNTYHVAFPTEEEAREIFCKYTFKKNFAPDGFEKLVERVTELCSNLPLGLSVMGSSLRRKKKEDWEGILHRLESSLDRKIDSVLRLGYDGLHKDDQFLFLLIACFFNYKDNDYVKTMLDDRDMDVTLGLKTLRYKSLISISTKGKIVMHKLLQQVGREAVQRQDPRKRQILIDFDDICDVLENDSDSRGVVGICLDIATIPNGVYTISRGAFRNMRKLRFLNIYKSRHDANVRVNVPGGMYIPPRLRLLHWEVYPRKCLPLTFRPEYLVELNMSYSKLEKLWAGNQHLPYLKKLDLSWSWELKELPDLSNATNLENLILNCCKSLVEIPASLDNLHKLERLDIQSCRELQVVPTLFNLAALESVEMWGCPQLRKIPDLSRNITELRISDTMLEEVPESITLWSHLRKLVIFGRGVGEKIGRDIEKIPECIKDLHYLEELYIISCPKIASLPEFSSSVSTLVLSDCKSLDTISLPFDSIFKYVNFANCFKLGLDARRMIIQKSCSALLPGRTIPAEFDHQATGNYLTICSSDVYLVRICVVISPKQEMEYSDFFHLLCRVRINGYPIDENISVEILRILGEHIFMITYGDGCSIHNKEISFEFSATCPNIDVIQCGAQILRKMNIDDDERLSDGSYESCCSEKLSGDDDERLSDGSYESCCSEKLSEDDDERLSDVSYESCLEL